MAGRSGILWFVLDKESSERLRSAVPPRFPNEHYHHVTLRYGVFKDEVAQFMGKEWRISAETLAYNGDAQACRVETNGLPDEYGAPHITLSTRQGIKPFASVAMLQGQHNETTFVQPIKLSGTVEFEYLDRVKD